MTNDAYAGTSDRRIALLIDADNISHTKIALILAELARYGTANIRRAYGDWANAQLRGWQDKVHAFAIKPIQQFSYTRGKNATDIALVIDAMELLYTQRLDAFCLATSDADFTPLVMQLKASGLDVHGFGERKSPAPFVNACSTFLFLDGSDASPMPNEANGRIYEEMHASSSPTPFSSSPAEDARLVTILRGALEATARDDGWAMLANVGHAVKRLAPIDPRNYGVRNLTALYEAIDVFDVKRAENGHPYVSEKRNVDRAPQP